MNPRAINFEKSTRRITLVLLHFNLIGNIWGLITTCGKFSNLSYKQFLHDEISILLDIVLIMIGSLVFFITFVAILNIPASSSRLLTMAIVFSMLDAFYIIYGAIRMHFDDNVKELFLISVRRVTTKIARIEQSSYWFPIESFSSSMLLVIVFVVIGVAFKLYSALIFHIYKLFLQRCPKSGPIVTRDHPSAPHIYYVQCTNGHHVSQPPQFFTQNLPSMHPIFPQ